MAGFDPSKYLDKFEKKYGKNFSFKLACAIDDEFYNAHNSFKFNINAQQECSKMTILHYACNAGECDAAEYLLENGANRHIADINGETPIFYAIKSGDNVDFIKALLGVDINERPQTLSHENYAKIDVMRCAIQNGRINIVKYFLKEFPTIYNISSLQSLANFAATNNNAKILQIIIDFYRSKTHESPNNSFSEDIESWKETFPITDVAKNDDVQALKIFLNCCFEGAYIPNLEPNFEPNFKIYFEILENAILYDAKAILEHIKAAATLKTMKKIVCRTDDSTKNTILHIAVKKGNLEIFQELLKFFDNVHLFNELGDTPMHFAARNKRTENETPLSIICEKNFQPMISFVCENVDLKSTQILCYSSKGGESITMFQMSLSLAIETKNRFLLEHLTNDSDDFEDYKKKGLLHEGLKDCIKNKFKDGVEYLLKLDEKLSSFRHVFDERIYDDEDETPFKLLIKHMPDIAYEVLEKLSEHSKVFAYYDLNIFNDMCYYGSPEVPSDKQENLSISKSHPINLMIKEKCYKLLCHPLIEFYVDAKWNRFARWYHYCALLYQITLIIYASIILFNVIPESQSPEMAPLTPIPMNSNVFNATPEFQPLELRSVTLDPLKPNIIRICLLSLSFKCFIFGVFLGFLQLIATLFRSFQAARQTWNSKTACCSTICHIIKHECLNFIILINIAIVVLPVCKFPLIIQFMEILILNLFIWISLFNHLEQHPRLGVYITMIKFILKSFCRFLPVLIIILLPFVIKFFVVLKKRNNLSFYQMFVKTLAMMYGDFNYNDNFGDHNDVDNNITNTTDFDNDGFVIDQYNLIKPTLFCFFLLFAIIFLNNLVLGLAIDDVSKILEEAFIRRRIKQIQSIHHIENAMPHFIKRQCWSNYCEMHIYISGFKKGSYCCPPLQNLKYYTFWFTKYFGLPKSTILKKSEDENQIEKIEAKLKSLESLMEKILKKLEEQKLD